LKSIIKANKLNWRKKKRIREKGRYKQIIISKLLDTRNMSDIEQKAAPVNNPYGMGGYDPQG